MDDISLQQGLLKFARHLKKCLIENKSNLIFGISSPLTACLPLMNAITKEITSRINQNTGAYVDCIVLLEETEKINK